MRWLEYVQRLRGEMRGALPDAAGEVAPTLLAAATTGGARALSLPAGRIAAGCWADLVAVDLRAPALAEVPRETTPGGAGLRGRERGDRGDLRRGQLAPRAENG